MPLLLFCALLVLRIICNFDSCILERCYCHAEIVAEGEPLLMVPPHDDVVVKPNDDDVNPNTGYIRVNDEGIAVNPNNTSNANAGMDDVNVLTDEPIPQKPLSTTVEETYNEVESVEQSQQSIELCDNNHGISGFLQDNHPSLGSTLAYSALGVNKYVSVDNTVQPVSLPKFKWILKHPQHAINSIDVFRSVGLRWLLEHAAKISYISVEEKDAYFRKYWKSTCEELILINGCKDILDNIESLGHLKPMIIQETKRMLRRILQHVSVETLLHQFQFTPTQLKKLIMKHIQHTLLSQKLLALKLVESLTESTIDETYKTTYVKDKCVPEKLEYSCIYFAVNDMDAINNDPMYIKSIGNKIYQDLQEQSIDSVVNFYQQDPVLFTVSNIGKLTQSLVCLSNDLQEAIHDLKARNLTSGVCRPIIKDNNICIIYVHHIQPSSYPRLSDPKVYNEVRELVIKDTVAKTQETLYHTVRNRYNKYVVYNSWPGAIL